jgi:hypothetical protein
MDVTTTRRHLGPGVAALCAVALLCVAPANGTPRQARAASGATAKPRAASSATAKARTPASTAVKAPVTPSAAETAAPAGADVPRPGAPQRDSAATEGSDRLKGGQEGTVFRSLTVEGEDRVHLEFERPPLELALDPAHAPGLEWGTARDVLDRSVPDVTSPLMALSGREAMPYLARPWLAAFGTGAVARFQPDMSGVERWKLMIADSRGHAVASFSGRGAPPRDLSWDGRGSDGSPVMPGLTYSYVFEAYDRAGNKRNIVGKGFSVSAYRFSTPEGQVLTFCGDSLWSALPASAVGGRGEPERTPELLLEAASWLDQSGRPDQPVRVTATARNREQAEALARTVTKGIGPVLIGGEARLRPITVVQPDAPAGGTVTLAPGR